MGINPREEPEWPEPPSVANVDDPRIESFKAQVTEAATRRGAYDVALHESHAAVEAAQIDVLKSSVERARDSGKTIQTAATGIATLYTGAAALVFSVSDKKPLPLRGILPVLFLGAAIIFATVYLAWLGPASRVGPFPVTNDATGLRIERVKWFNNWVSLSILKKAWALRLATLYLAAGLVFLPVAFVAVDPTATESTETVASGGSKTLPSWPDRPSVDDGINRILFKAQVSEVATARQEAAKADTGVGRGGGFDVPEKLIWGSALIIFAAAAVIVGWQHRLGALGKAIKRLTYKPPADEDSPSTSSGAA